MYIIRKLHIVIFKRDFQRREHLLFTKFLGMRD